MSLGLVLLSVGPLSLAIFVLDRVGAVRLEALFSTTGVVLGLIGLSAIGSLALVRSELRRVVVDVVAASHRTLSEELARRRQKDEEGIPRESVAPAAPPVDVPSATSKAPTPRAGRSVVRAAEVLMTSDGELPLEPFLHEALEAVRAKTAYLMAPDESRGEFITVGAAGDGATELSGQRIPLGEGIAAAAARERAPLLLSNPERLAVSEGDESAASAPLDTMAAPLLRGESLAGVLIIQSPRDDREFDGDDFVLLTNLSRLMVAALDRSAAARLSANVLEDTLGLFAREIDERNPYTRGHSERVARYCQEMARSLDLDDDSVRVVCRAALLHDIGKLLLPESIIRKEDRLTDEELELLRTHSARAEAMVRRIPAFAPIAPIIRHHHERCDGSGYPDGVSGDDLPLTTHILIVANAFDIMTSDRSYRQANSLLQSLRMLQEDAGTKYDRRAVQALCGLDRAILTAPIAAGFHREGAGERLHLDPGVSSAA
jgi:HD-GYP domain-containing protein (c-di-GMP phosphodiesterase class II)